ncbi:MAG: MFS transporter [Alphaproteobacteria bacterium]|nr:MFS transporter [Alphaproteobacteria bacterium]
MLARHPIALLVAAGGAVALITLGIRIAFGLFLEPMSATFGWGREVFAFALALQNLLWGVGQPIAGAIADRYGSARVMAAGGVLYAGGVALMAFAGSPIELYATAGVMVGFGTAGASFTVVLAALGRLLPPERRGWAFGLVTAAGSLGQFLIAPLGQALLADFGWHLALLYLSALSALVIVMAAPFRSDRTPAAAAGAQTLGQALGEAWHRPSYWYLLAGFFVCGFHVAFVQTHLPATLSDAGLPASTGAWALSLIGLFNVAGAYLAGPLGERMRKKWLLSAIYGARAVVLAGFVLIPVTSASALVFAAAMGFLWLSTVPPTSGLVAAMFGPRYLATLFGIVFFSHQMGAFLGAWLGGIAYDLVGSYAPVWWISAGLGVFAALINLPIDERARLAPAKVPT